LMDRGLWRFNAATRTTSAMPCLLVAVYLLGFLRGARAAPGAFSGPLLMTFLSAARFAEWRCSRVRYGTRMPQYDGLQFARNEPRSSPVFPRDAVRRKRRLSFVPRLRRGTRGGRRRGISGRCGSGSDDNGSAFRHRLELAVRRGVPRRRPEPSRCGSVAEREKPGDSRRRRKRLAVLGEDAPRSARGRRRAGARRSRRRAGSGGA
jgi:hypothetical protein